MMLKAIHSQESKAEACEKAVLVAEKLQELKLTAAARKVEEGIEGLVHVSELSSKKIKSPAELYKEGQEIQAKVIHVSAEERRLGLSIKQIKDDEDRRKPKEFHAGPQEAGQSLGDLLKAAQENN